MSARTRPKRLEHPADHRRRTFYNETRAKAFPATFSMISGLGPLVIFGGTVALLAGLLADGGQPAGLKDNQEALQLPLDAFCHSKTAHGPLLNVIFAATIRFAATHAALAVICLVSFAVSIICVLNTLKTHGFCVVSRWVMAFLVPLGLGAAAFCVARAFVGNQIAELLERISAIPAPASDCGVLRDGETLERALDWHIRIGAGAVSVAVASLLVAAACLAYRYERNHINGPWSDSYVLRQKLNSLLTVFFVGSALLVITNVALNSAMGWSGALLDVISDAMSANSPKERRRRQAPRTRRRRRRRRPTSRQPLTRQRRQASARPPSSKRRPKPQRSRRSSR